MFYIKIIDGQIIPISGIVDESDTTIVKLEQNVPPYVKGRQVPNFIGIDISVTPPVANFTIVDVSVNDRKLMLIHQLESMKERNLITLETAFQRIDAITNCITHDDIDAYEQSIQQS